jgi:hypothetical protein
MMMVVVVVCVYQSGLVGVAWGGEGEKRQKQRRRRAREEERCWDQVLRRCVGNIT